MSRHVDLERIALEAMDLAHEIFINNAPGALTQKTDRDFASELDFAIERELRSYLGEVTPDIGFLGEEEGATNVSSGGAFWALDPVDGTANLLHGLPLCGSSLDLIDDGEPILGIIDLPLINERYTARRGFGAFCNGRPLTASSTQQLESAIVSTGDYAVGPRAYEKNIQRFDLTQQLANRVERIRMLGSAAIDLAWVAAGRLDASIILANKPWDVAAGVIIAREAGAHVIDLDGTRHGLRSTATICAAPDLLDDLRDLLISMNIDPSLSDAPPVLPI
jgi:myo-inositol-1(or 4)-monophosphatase